MSIYFGSVSQWDTHEKADGQAAKVIEEATELFRAVRDGDVRAVMEEGADTVQAVANLLNMYGIHTFQVDMNRCYMKHLKRNCRKDV